MATKFTKQKIDFDVYEKANPESQVNWADQAGKLTKVVEGIRDERQGRKDAIEKSFQDQQIALNDIGEYDNATMQQMVMNGAQDGANKSVDFNNLVKRGLAKPSEYKMFLHNQRTGFDLLKKNATNFDVSFKEYSERTTKNLNAPQEIWMAKQLEGFANINNLQVQTDPETGNVVQLRVDPVTGEPLTGESMSVQHMTLLMKQRVDKFDVNTATDNISKSIGDIITAGIRSNGITSEITTEMRSRAETEFFATKDGQKTLTLKAQQMIDNPQDQAAMLVSNTPGPNGETNFYKIGSQEDFDNYDGDEASNPIVVMEFGADNLYTPKFTESQDKAALEYAKTNITAKLNVKQTADIKKTQATEYQENAASIAAGRQDEEADASGKSVNLLVTGSAVEAEAASKDLISSFENLTDIDRVVDADGKVTAFNIKVKGKVVDPIKTTDSEGNAKTPDQLNREIFKLVGAKGTYDAWLKRNKVGENIGEGGSSSSQAADEISYNLPSDMVVVGDSKITYDSFFNSESGGNLGSTLAEFGFSDDGEAEVQQGFTNLLDSPSFIPKGLKDFISNDGGKISVKVGESGGAKNNQMVITIGNEVITYDDVYLDESTGGTTGISQKIREAIEKEVKRANTGGGKKTKKKNVG